MSWPPRLASAAQRGRGVDQERVPGRRTIRDLAWLHRDLLDRGAGRHELTESRGGDVTGMLPYSRLVTSSRRWIAQEPTEILASAGAICRDDPRSPTRRRSSCTRCSIEPASSRRAICSTKR